MVGRKRIGGNPLGLELRCYWHHGQVWYRPREGKPIALGSDIAKANERAKVYNDPDGRYGTLGYWMDMFIEDAKGKRILKPLSPRTIEDYEDSAGKLKPVFEKNHPLDLVEQPHLIAEYRDTRSADYIDDSGAAQDGAPVRANREMSFMSALYTWMIDKGKCPGLKANPVTQIKRNTEKPKERYVEDREYSTVYGVATRSVCQAMTLEYLTLQRPADILAAAPQAVRVKSVAGLEETILRVRQGKRGRIVDIKVTAELDAALRMCSPDGQLESMPLDNRGKVRLPLATIVHTVKGKPYTLEGIGAMIRRYCIKTKVKTFGLMDIRAKGATDMYLRGVPLETIQLLMGHKSKTTTEIYIKRLLATISIATPNTAAALA